MRKTNTIEAEIQKTDSQLNQPNDSFIEQQHLNDVLPFFPNTYGPSRMNTTFASSANDYNSHSTPKFPMISP